MPDANAVYLEMMINHNERINVARELCSRFVGQYALDVLIGGVYGSTANGLDTEWSDLEMLFIVDDKCIAGGQQILYRNCPICYSVLKKTELEQILSRPELKGDSGWPFWMGVLSVIKVLYGDPALIENWLNMGKEAPNHMFRKSLEKALPGLVHESYGRLLSCKQRNNHDDWYCAVLEVLFEMRDALCLLNKSWVTHDYYQGLKDTFEFQLRPQRWEEIVPKLWRVRDLDEAIMLTKELTDDFWILMTSQDMTLKDYDKASDIPL